MAVSSGRIIEPDSDQLETWQNVTRGRVVIKRLGAMGQTREEMIGDGKIFHLTPQERRMNQEVSANDELDFFLNGTLQPITLTDTVDAEFLKDNPNLLGDEEQVLRLFKAGPDVFAERLATITNANALERLKTLAYQDDTGATIAQSRMIEARLAQIAPEVTNVHPPTSSAEPAREGNIKAVTPR